MKILIADDESIIRMGLRSMLHELGHTVHAAKNGRDAVCQFQKYKPDLAILDIRMPYKDGIQTARELASSNNPIPIIILTADGNELMIERASTLPIQAYLIKPIKSPAELVATIAVATKRFADQQMEIEKRAKLEEKLQEKDYISRAQLILIKKNHWTEADAHKYLQQTARNNNRKMVEIAADIIMVDRAERVLSQKFNCTTEEANQRIITHAMATGLPLKQASEELMCIESAKSILVTKFGLDDATAHEKLLQRANDANRPVVDIAKAIIINNKK